MNGFLLAIGLLVVALVAPGIRSGRTTVRDLHHSERETTFDGLAVPDGSTLKVLLVHGMGNGVEEWTGKPRRPIKEADRPDRYGVTLMDDVAQRLQLVRKSDPADHCIPINPCGQDPKRNAKLTTWHYEDGGRRLEVYQVQWSPLLNEIKYQQLLREESRNGKSRVAINRSLKGALMNERFSDPVMYLGKHGENVRKAIQFGLWSMMHGGKIASSATLDWSDARLADNEFMAMISWSLGSKAMFDAIEKLPPSQRGLIARRTSHLYMLANQLPLLALADADLTPQPVSLDGVRSVPMVTAPNDSLASFIGARQFAPRGLDGTQALLTIVAFSDPNDLLSYPIPTTFKPLECGDPNRVECNEASSDRRARFINVTTPVGRKHVAWQLVHPMKAHTGHGQAKGVMRLLVNPPPKP